MSCVFLFAQMYDALNFVLLLCIGMIPRTIIRIHKNREEKLGSVCNLLYYLAFV